MSVKLLCFLECRVTRETNLKLRCILIYGVEIRKLWTCLGTWGFSMVGSGKVEVESRKLQGRNV